MTNNTPRQCVYCGKEFRPKKLGGRHVGKYCSLWCFRISKRKQSNCLKCGQEFFVKHHRRLHCSVGCARANLGGDKNPSWKGGKATSMCPECKKDFMYTPAGNRVYCSKKCLGKAQGKLFSRDKNPNFRGGHQLGCANCGKKVWRAPSQLASKSFTYCSPECFQIHNSRRTAPRWQKGSRWGSAKGGKRHDLGDQFFRSSWEANYARYLNFLLSSGKIKSWSYESETFEFYRIKKGTRLYTPDFRVVLLNDKIEFHEVKGWMRPKGATQLKRMAIYYPKVKIVLVDKSAYEIIRKAMHKVLSGWE